MTLGELIECGLIKDDDTIAVHLHLIGGLTRVRRGQWYQDHILWDIDLQTKEED